MPPIARMGLLLWAVTITVAQPEICRAQVFTPEPNDGPLTRVWLDASRRSAPAGERASAAAPARRRDMQTDNAPSAPPAEISTKDVFEDTDDLVVEKSDPRTSVQPFADPLVAPAAHREQPIETEPVVPKQNKEPNLLKSSGAIPLRGPEKRLESRDDPDSSRGGTSTVAMCVTVGSSLAVVLGLFFVFAWFVRRSSGRATAALPKEAVEVLGRTPLAGKQYIHLIRCGNKIILVSVSPEHAEPLAEITEPGEVDRLTGLCRRALPGSASLAFQKAFRDLERSSA